MTDASFAERHPFYAVCVILVGCAIPGVILWFAVGSSTWVGVVAGVLGIPCAVIAVLIVEVVASVRSSR